MNERHKMKLSDNIPEGLEYKTEYWDSALNLIKRKETQLFWYKIMGLSATVLLIAGAFYWQVEHRAAVAMQANSSQPHIIASASPLAQLFTSSHEQLVEPIELNKTILYDQELPNLLSSNVEVLKSSLQESKKQSEGREKQQAPSNSKGVNAFAATNASQADAEVKHAIQSEQKTRAIASDSQANFEQTLNPISSDTELAQNKIQSVQANENGNMQEQTIAKAKEYKNQSGVEVSIAKANEKGNNAQAVAIANEQDNSLSAQPEGSILEKKSARKENWNLLPSNLLSKSIQIIPQKTAKPGSPVIVGNLESLAQSFPIPHYSIQLVLGNGFRTQYGSRINGTSFQPIAGLAFDYNLNKKWSFNIEGNYSQVNNVLRKIERTNRQLDYILRSQTTLLSTTKLHFMNLPIQVARRLGERHQIHAGLGLSYLLTTDNLIQVSSQTSFESEQGETQETQGYTQGWQPISTFGMLGYSYYLKPSTSIRVSYQYGFTDMTDNAEFSESAFDRNSQLNLTLHFNLIER